MILFHSEPDSSCALLLSDQVYKAIPEAQKTDLANVRAGPNEVASKSLDS